MMETALLDETSLDYIAGGRNLANGNDVPIPMEGLTENGKFLKQLALCCRGN